MQMYENLHVRYPDLVRARIPRELSDAVNATARARFMTTSEYLRQSLLKSLKDDGTVVPQTVSVAA
jgi:hypothetical protein